MSKKTTDVVHEYLEEQGWDTRGEAEQVLADFICLTYPDDDDDALSDGTVIQALRIALNRLVSSEQAETLIKEWEG